MNYRTIKWTIFTALFLTAPALLFLIQVVIFLPAIFFVAGIVYVIPKAFSPGHVGESLAFMAFLGVHVLIFAGLYYLVSTLCAKVITFIKEGLARNCTVGALCLGLAGVTQLPVYGSGGHSPMHWVTLPQALTDLDKSYGAGTVWIVYGTALLVFSGVLLLRHLRSHRSGPEPTTGSVRPPG